MIPLNFQFQLGQCWTSEGEPELGIGFIREMDAQSITLDYPSTSQARTYRKKNAPLRRLEFRVGEKVQSQSGTQMTIDRIEVRENLNWYLSDDGIELPESELSSKLTLQRPMDRFLAGQWDSFKAFSLRRRTLKYYHRHLHSEARGMMGPKVQLLPHQIFVTREISKRGLPRALLADEVGLGKTIEAAWIMHRLLASERIRRVLIIVPESLVNQWFVELFRRFNLSFWVPASQTTEALELGDIADQERVILSLESVVDAVEKGLLKTEDWDLVIVDEAHRITWTETEISPEYKVLKSLAEKTQGLLLLTATPEQLGLEGHFSRLHLIDPIRFPTLDLFKKEHANYVAIASRAASSSLTRAEALEIIDQHGTGRVYFRNARSVVEVEGFSFPKRVLMKHEITEGKDSLVRWLADFITAHPKQKCLLICSSAKKVIEWEKRLKDDYAIKVSSFHEELSLLARDRNAAFFEDPAGASVLLCSEIGGEGRNFQHASHLILADLPEDPDLLEQRIGRLDRIGQNADISIHVPYTLKSHTARVLRWHEEVFQSFSAPPKGAQEIYHRHQSQWAEMREGTITKASDVLFEALLATARSEYLKQLETLESGRDRLIEINSFDPLEARRLVRVIQDAEQTEELKIYLEELLDALGLHSDDLDPDSIFVQPGDGQYVSYFPGLPPEGLSFTFSRAKALRRNDLALMTWDHPMVSETLSQLVRQEYGNVSVAQWPKQLVALECNFVFEASAIDSKWYADEFFPSTAIRVMLDATGRELTAQVDYDTLLSGLKPLTPAVMGFVKKLPGDRIRKLLGQAHSHAQTVASDLRQRAFTQMNLSIDYELTRLKALQSKNHLVSETEIQWWLDRKSQLTQAFNGAQVRVDSFLLIVPETLA
jgi:ATP-dependent helicase HepA